MVKRTTEPVPSLDLLDERASAFQQSAYFHASGISGYGSHDI